MATGIAQGGENKGYAHTHTSIVDRGRGNRTTNEHEQKAKKTNLSLRKEINKSVSIRAHPSHNKARRQAYACIYDPARGRVREALGLGAS